MNNETGFMFYLFSKLQYFSEVLTLGPPPEDPAMGPNIGHYTPDVNCCTYCSTPCTLKVESCHKVQYWADSCTAALNLVESQEGTVKLDSEYKAL